MGRPSASSMADTVSASSSVRRNVCQSIAMYVALNHSNNAGFGEIRTQTIGEDSEKEFESKLPILFRKKRESKDGATSLAAGGRDDSVHSQVFDHLAVMIIGVPGNTAGKAEARDFSLAKWASYFSCEIRVID